MSEPAPATGVRVKRLRRLYDKGTTEGSLDSGFPDPAGSIGPPWGSLPAPSFGTVFTSSGARRTEPEVEEYSVVRQWSVQVRVTVLPPNWVPADDDAQPNPSAKQAAADSHAVRQEESDVHEHVHSPQGTAKRSRQAAEAGGGTGDILAAEGGPVNADYASPETLGRLPNGDTALPRPAPGGARDPLDENMGESLLHAYHGVLGNLNRSTLSNIGRNRPALRLFMIRFLCA